MGTFFQCVLGFMLGWTYKKDEQFRNDVHVFLALAMLVLAGIVLAVLWVANEGHVKDFLGSVVATIVLIAWICYLKPWKERS